MKINLGHHAKGGNFPSDQQNIQLVGRRWNAAGKIDRLSEIQARMDRTMSDEISSGPLFS